MIGVLGAEKLSLVEIEAFLAASESVRFVGCGRTEIYLQENQECSLSTPTTAESPVGGLFAIVRTRPAPSARIYPWSQTHWPIAIIKAGPGLEDVRCVPSEIP